MGTHILSNETNLTRYKDAPARTITAGGVTYAYRELGPRGGVTVVFFVHLAGNMDNWDPVSYTHLDVYKRQGPTR